MAYIPQVSGDPKTLRSSSALTGSFVESLALKTNMWNQVILFLDVTLTTATDIRVQLQAASPTRTPGTIIDAEPSAGSSEWHDVAFQDGANAATATAVTTVPITTFEMKLTASGRYAFPLPVNYQWIRCKAKATGGDATLTIKATTGMA